MSEGAPEPMPHPAPSGNTPSEAPRDSGAWLERVPWWTVPAVFLVVAAAGIGLAEANDDFFPEIVWKYYWGPIVADAWDCASLGHRDYLTAIANGLPQPSDTCGSLRSQLRDLNPDGPGVLADSGYNYVNTLSWAVLLGLMILAAAQILRATKTPMDGRLVVGASLWVVAGSVFHVLEDTHLFAAPLQYFFITPIIYLLFAAFGIVSLVLGVYLHRVAVAGNLRLALHKLILILAIPVIGYLLLWSRGWPQVVVYVHPAWVLLCTVVTFLIVRRRALKQGRIEPRDLVGQLSTGWLLLSVVYVVAYVQKPWFPQTNPLLIALWAPLLAAALAALVWIICAVRLSRAEALGNDKKRDKLLAYLHPVGALVVFAQMTDGLATAIGIDLGHYGEKHVFSKNVIDWTRNFGETTGIDLLAQYPTFLGFATLKMVLSLVVVQMLYHPRNRAKQNPTVTGLVAFAIIMVGLGPGVRDFVRMALGV